MYKIAITGKANSGKNTTANILLEELSLANNKIINGKMMAFADPIKEIILTMFPLARKEFLYGSSNFRSQVIPNAKNKHGDPLTYRQALIDIGTMAREYNPNIWVDCFDNRVVEFQEREISLPRDLKTEAVIVTDLRFQEEFDYLIKNNYFIIKLNRKNHSVINDKSETAQDQFSKFNSIIDNNGTLIDLRNQIKEQVIGQIVR